MHVSEGGFRIERRVAGLGWTASDVPASRAALIVLRVDVAQKRTGKEVIV
jgi:hypothetical protein